MYLPVGYLYFFEHAQAAITTAFTAGRVVIVIMFVTKLLPMVIGMQLAMVALRIADC